MFQPMSMLRNSFRDRKEGYTDKAVVIRFAPFSMICFALHIMLCLILQFHILPLNIILIFAFALLGFMASALAKDLQLMAINLFLQGA